MTDIELRPAVREEQNWRQSVRVPERAWRRLVGLVERSGDWGADRTYYAPEDAIAFALAARALLAGDGVDGPRRRAPHHPRLGTTCLSRDAPPRAEPAAVVPVKRRGRKGKAVALVAARHTRLGAVSADRMADFRAEAGRPIVPDHEPTDSMFTPEELCQLEDVLRLLESGAGAVLRRVRAIQ